MHVTVARNYPVCMQKRVFTSVIIVIVMDTKIATSINLHKLAPEYIFLCIKHNEFIKFGKKVASIGYESND